MNEENTCKQICRVFMMRPLLKVFCIYLVFFTINTLRICLSLFLSFIYFWKLIFLSFTYSLSRYICNPHPNLYFLYPKKDFVFPTFTSIRQLSFDTASESELTLS